MSTVEKGRAAEEIAVQYLQEQGYVILARNYYIKGGEIDIVAQDKDTIIFAEVRMRKQNYFGAPEETVDVKKQQRIIKTAEHFLATHNLTDAYCRFDVLGVSEKKENDYEIRHYPNAFFV